MRCSQQELIEAVEKLETLGIKTFDTYGEEAGHLVATLENFGQCVESSTAYLYLKQYHYVCRLLLHCETDGYEWINSWEEMTSLACDISKIMGQG